MKEEGGYPAAVSIRHVISNQYAVIGRNVPHKSLIRLGYSLKLFVRCINS